MATEIDLLKAEIARIERELEAAKRKLARVEQDDANGDAEGDVRPFAKLRGIWKGVHFTEEEIESAEYKLDDPDHVE